MGPLDRLQRSPATITDYEDRAKRLILPTLGRRLIGDVTPADVEKVVASTTGERNKAYVVALIRKTVNFARDKKRYLPETHRNPAAGFRPRPKWPRIARALDADEIARFGAALATMEQVGEVSPWLANLFRLSLVCGLRPGEVRTLTWARVNLPRKKMTVVGKSGERDIHLTKAAVEVLEATPRVQGCEYVFAGRRYDQPIAAVHKMLTKVQARPWQEFNGRGDASTQKTEATELCQLPVSDLACADSVLFMAVPSGRIADALHVIAAWGFVYRGELVLVKEKPTPGSHARVLHDLLLIAERGEMPAPEPKAKPISLVEERLGKHTTRIDQLYRIIEAMYPEFDKIQLFAGPSPSRPKNWSIWGGEESPDRPDVTKRVASLSDCTP